MRAWFNTELYTKARHTDSDTLTVVTIVRATWVLGLRRTIPSVAAVHVVVNPVLHTPHRHYPFPNHEPS